jgi:putative transposase
MPQKRYRPEEIIAKLRQADVLLGEGKKVPEVVKAGVGSVAFTPARGTSRTGARGHACPSGH